METRTNLGSQVESPKMGEETSVEMESVVTEFAKGITSEQMQAMFFNNAELREPSYRLYQLNSRGKRYYYTFEGEEPTFYPSVTTVLGNVMPENRFLTEWKLSMGKEKAEAYTMERANYGSFIHGQLAQLMIARTYDLDGIREQLGKYAERNGLPSSFVDTNEDEAKADMVAFAKWMRDYDVRPLAVEVSLCSPTYGYAGTIDLVCSMREYSIEDTRKKATDDRIFAIVDYKTGKKGFYADYALQLEMYRRMWNETYPDVPIERIFNLSPKDWRSTVKKVPSFNFEEQTNNEELQCLDDYLEIFRKKFKEERRFTVCSGIINLSEDITDCVKVYDLEELVRSHKPQKEEEEEREISDSLFD